MTRDRLKVLTLVPELGLGGGENRILNLAKSIDRQRFDHIVATFYPRDPIVELSYGSLQPEFENAGIGVVDLGLPRPKRGAARFQAVQIVHTAVTLARAALRLRRFILQEGVQLVDAHLDDALLIAVPAAVLARIPILVTLYHLETIPPRRLLRPFRLASLRKIDGLLTDSQARAEEFATLLRARSCPIHVIPNGVRLAPPQTSRRQVLGHFDIPEDAECIIGQVSGLAPFKGHRFLLEAARRVLAGRPKTYFLCVGFSRGATANVKELEDQARALQISDRVRIASYPDSISDVWDVIDIHVHASTFDSLPNAILEGMSLGKPAVVTAVGGVPDVVEHGVTGLVVPPGNSSALAEAILSLISDRDLATRLGAAAKRRYMEAFTPESSTRSIEARFVAAVCGHVGSRDSHPKRRPA